MASTDRERWARVRPAVAWKHPGLPTTWTRVLERNPEAMPSRACVARHAREGAARRRAPPGVHRSAGGPLTLPPLAALRSNITSLCEAIDLMVEQHRVLPALILIYAGVDAVASPDCE